MSELDALQGAEDAQHERQWQWVAAMLAGLAVGVVGVVLVKVAILAVQVAK